MPPLTAPAKYQAPTPGDEDGLLFGGSSLTKTPHLRCPQPSGRGQRHWCQTPPGGLNELYHVWPLTIVYHL